MNPEPLGHTGTTREKSDMLRTKMSTMTCGTFDDGGGGNLGKTKDRFWHDGDATADFDSSIHTSAGHTGSATATTPCLTGS